MKFNHPPTRRRKAATLLAALSLASLSGAVAAQGMTSGGTAGSSGTVSGGAARSGPALTAPATANPAAPATAPGTATPSAAAPLPGQSAQPSLLPPLNANGVGGQPATALAAPGTLPSRTDTSATAFRQLDRGGVGYVTRADTDRIPGFVGFDNADTNRDGQLTAEEFNNAWRFYSGR